PRRAATPPRRGPPGAAVRRVEGARLACCTGPFPPARRASARPIAIACFRLFAVLPERPDLRVPAFRSCIALRTFDAAFLPYARAMVGILTVPIGTSISEATALLRTVATRAVGPGASVRDATQHEAHG